MFDHFFQPSGVAVVGVSLSAKKLGNQILENINTGGYSGHVYPVNARAGKDATVLDQKVYPRLVDIPGPVDLAVIVVPNAFVISVIEDCGAKGIDAAVVITAGFKEVGKEGKELEQQLVATAQRVGVRCVGPNCLGVIDTHHRLNASFAPLHPPCGNIAFLSQSGALGCAILDQGEGQHVGFSTFVSLGNKADLDEVDFLRIFQEDPHTKVIMGYLESIERGPEFVAQARETTRTKPVIILKSGRSQAGQQAASSHTGALSGQDESFSTVFRETGIIRADTVSEAFNIARGFAHQSPPGGKRVIVLTNAGGAGIVATDAAENHDLELVSLGDTQRTALGKKLPGAASLGNPVDILGDAKADRYAVALEEISKDDAIDGIITLLTPQSATEVEATAEALGRFSRTYGKPVLASFMGKSRVEDGVTILKKWGIPNYPDPQDAVSTFRAMADYHAWLSQPEKEIPRFFVDRERVEAILTQHARENHFEIGGISAIEIFDAYGIPVVSTRLATDPAEATALARQLGDPVVLKVESPVILHKSDMGGVEVGISHDEAARAFELIMERACAVAPEEQITGVAIQSMAAKGQEVLCGISFDPTFQHFIKCGLGGKYVELFADVASRRVPISRSDAREMIGETRYLSHLLRGIRGERPSDVSLVEETLLRLSQLVCDFPSIKEIEANPLIVWEEGGAVLDARLRFEA